MALKPILDSLDGVDEAIQSLYREEGGKYILDLDDGMEEHPAVAALKRARDHERKAAADAKKEAADLKAEIEKYADIDPARAREALGKLQELEDKKLIDEGDIDKLVEQRTERMKSTFDSQLEAKNRRIEELEASNGNISGKLADLMIYSQVEKTALENAARPGALDDIRNRARSIFKMEDDKVVAYKPGTEDPLYGKDSNPMTIDEWVAGLASDAPHLFEQNGGGGGQGSGGGGSRSGGTVISPDQVGSNIDKIAAGEVTVNRG